MFKGKCVKSVLGELVVVCICRNKSPQSDLGSPFIIRPPSVRGAGGCSSGSIQKSHPFAGRFRCLWFQSERATKKHIVNLAAATIWMRFT